MDATKIVECVALFAKASHACGKGEHLLLARLAESGKLAVVENACRALAENPTTPSLLQFSCDTTPVSLRKHVSFGKAGEQEKRSGKIGYEFQVQQCYVTCFNLEGEKEVCLVFGPAVPVLYGKSMRALTGIALASPGLKVMSRYAGQRILLYHQVHDRAVGQKLRHSLSGHWARLASSAAEAGEMDENSAGYEVLSWHTEVSCSLHDIHNSLRWGYLLSLGKQEDCIKALYVGTIALKSSSFYCVSSIGSWLLDVVEAVPVEDCPLHDELFGLYLLLGLGHSVADGLATRRVHWKHDVQKMVVALEVINEEADWMAGVSSILLSVYQFHVFTESRWSTVGAASRNILCSSVLGYKHFLHHMRRQGCVSEYYVSGADRLTRESLLLAAVVSLTSHFTDALLFLALADGRLARQYDDICMEMATEFETIEQIPVFVWSALGQAIDARPSVLRDHVVHSVLVAWSYLQHKLLNTLECLPFSLCCMPPVEALNIVGSLAEEPRQPVAGKIHRLLSIGYPKHLLVQGLELLSECSFSSRYTETLHGSTAVMRKYHPEASPVHVLYRAYVHSLRNVMPGEGTEHRESNLLRLRLQRLERRNPNYITGRQIYFRDHMSKARLKATTREKTKYTLKGTTIMRIHGQYWDALTHEEKDAYNRKASEVRSATQHVLDEEIRDTESRLQIAVMRETSAVQRASTSMVASSARLPDSALRTWSTLSSARVFADGNLRKLGENAMKGVESLSAEREQELVAASLLDKQDTEPKSSLYVQVARNRDKFLNACFAVESSDGIQWFRCILAIVTPPTLQFMEVREVEVQPVPFHVESQVSTFSQLTRASFSYKWSFDSVQFTSRDIFVDADPDFVGVVTPTSFKATSTLVAWSDLLALSSFLQEEGPCVEESEPKPKKPRIVESEAQSGLIVAHPWLRALGATSRASSSTSALPEEAPQEPDTGTAVESQDIVEVADREIFHALRSALRADNTGEGHTDTDDSMFAVSILGGKWNVERTGRKLYGSRYDVRKESAAHKCCSLHGMKLSASFDYHAHGEETAKTLATLYQAKIMHVVRHWLGTGSEAKLASCPPFVVPPDLKAPDASQKMSLRRWNEYLNMGPPTE
eukprot:6491046-Amphidinium_carterae.5